MNRILNKRDLIISIFLFSVTFFSRLYLVEGYQSHWDGPQYAIALFNYSFENQTPAPPGYPLYLGLAYLINLIVDNPHHSLLFESVLFSAIGSCVVYFFGKFLGGVRTGIIAAVLYVTSPVIFFFGLTAYAYGVTSVVTLIFALISYRILFLKKKEHILFAVFYGILLGFRPQDLLYTFPLFLYIFLKIPNSKKMITTIVFLFTCSLWLVPHIIIVGDIYKYINYVFPFGAQKIPQPSILNFVYSPEIYLKGLFLTLGLSILILLYYVFIYIKNININVLRVIINKEFQFFSLWIIPPLLFNLFIRSDHAGYQLPYLLPLMLILSVLIGRVFNTISTRFIFVLIFLSISNFFIFFRDRDPKLNKPYIPTSFHFSEIQKNDIKMKAKIEYIKKNFNNNETLIIIAEPDYFKPAMYHLPDYNIYQISRIETKNDNFINIVREARNYNSIEYRYNSYYFKPSPTFKNIIFWDDEMENWVGIKGKETITLNGNSSITVTDNPKTIRVDYHFLN